MPLALKMGQFKWLFSFNFKPTLDLCIFPTEESLWHALEASAGVCSTAVMTSSNS